MSIFTLTDAYISINAVVLSDHSNQVTVEDSRERKDITTFGAQNRAVQKGLGGGKMTVRIFQDFDAGKTHATLQPLIGSKIPVTVEIRPTSAARSVTNPAAVMSALLFNYNFVDGEVGEPSVITAEFENADAQTGITYPTS